MGLIRGLVALIGSAVMVWSLALGRPALIPLGAALAGLSFIFAWETPVATEEAPTQERLIAAARAAYTEGRIEIGEFEADVGRALNGQDLGHYEKHYSTEEPAGPYHVWVRKYPEA